MIFEYTAGLSNSIEQVVDERLYEDRSKDERSSDQSASRYSTRGRKESRNFIKLGKSRLIKNHKLKAVAHFL